MLISRFCSSLPSWDAGPNSDRWRPLYLHILVRNARKRDGPRYVRHCASVHPSITASLQSTLALCRFHPPLPTVGARCSRVRRSLLRGVRALSATDSSERLLWQAAAPVVAAMAVRSMLRAALLCALLFQLATTARASSRLFTSPAVYGQVSKRC